MALDTTPAVPEVQAPANLSLEARTIYAQRGAVTELHQLIHILDRAPELAASPYLAPWLAIARREAAGADVAYLAWLERERW